MLAEVTQNLVYIGEKELISKKTDEPFTLVTVADPVAYQQFDFFKQSTLNTRDLQQGDVVQATIELTKQGFTTNTNLVTLLKV